MKALLALPLLAAASNAPAPPSHFAVVQVRCNEVNGTAFRIGPGKFASVAHVTTFAGCKVGGIPIQVTRSSGDLDASEFDLAGDSGSSVEIDCGGFRDGETYFAIGYANGLPVQRTVVIKSSDYATWFLRSRNGGMQVFTGVPTVIPGQSGGPVLNAAGKAVGLVNAYNPFLGVSYSRAFKDTPLCQK